MGMVFNFAHPTAAVAEDPFAVILVDKKSHQLHLAHYDQGFMKIVKSFHVTLGKVVGDKVQTDDKKTPEGVYIILSKRTPPNLQRKFGSMAFPVNYPNPMDKRLNKTGFGIMLHSTDDPSRLTRDYDSDGCVVVDNHEIAEISKHVQLGLTPMLIYEELKPDYLKEFFEPKLKSFFDKWVQAWANKDIENYIAAYSPQFRSNGMTRDQYKSYKTSLTKKYARIEVAAENPRIYYHPKYDVVAFTQKYASYDARGRKLFQSNGTKFLYLDHDAAGDHKIAFEDFTQAMEVHLNVKTPPAEAPKVSQAAKPEAVQQ